MSAFHIRTAQAHDMDYIIGLLAEAGWNPGLHDAQCFFASDPQGFLIAHLGEQAIGCVSAVRYPDVSATDFGFIGCYIMQPPWRGQIYGAWLGMHAMKLLQDCNIGIDGVVEQQAHYAHFGFSMAHRNLRYMGDCSTWPTDQSGLDI
ncbi:MAG: GNAT family N-acetyltransferase, partial [Methylophilaceae bacterium]